MSVTGLQLKKLQERKYMKIIPEGYTAEYNGALTEIKETNDGIDFIIHFKTLDQVNYFIKEIECKPVLPLFTQKEKSEI